jgi:ubiquinone/menaquinone biosynthesis C-methylase UbiE
VNTLHGEKKNKISFSNYVETYRKEVQSSIDFAGQDLDFFIKLKADLIVQLAGKHFNNPESIKILDIGSGIGLTDRHLTGYFTNMHGVDVENEVIKKASSYNPGVKYELYDGLNLPFGSSTFEIAFAINVLHHVPPGKRENFVKEMYRVVRDGGISIVFEHNPVNPLTRLAVSRCEFDRDAVLIHKKNLKKIFRTLGFKSSEKAFILFFPYKGKFFRVTEKILSWLPLGAQYFIAGKK